MPTQLAETRLDLAGDRLADQYKRQEVYEEEAKAAPRVLEVQDSNAQAHSLDAAGLGRIQRIKGMTKAAMKMKGISGMWLVPSSWISYMHRPWRWWAYSRCASLYF
jgi:hypothetical protein